MIKKKMNRKGEAGISIMVIMITSILITLMIVGLYLFTANKFQVKSQETVEKSKENIFNKIEISDLTSTYNNTKLKTLEATVKMKKGSNGLTLSDLTIKITSPYANSNLQFRPGGDIARDSANGYYTNATSNTGYFVIKYLQKSKNHQEDMLFTGDLAKIYFETAHELDTEDTVTLKFVPKKGIETIKMFVTPRTPGVGRVSLSHY